MSCQARPLELTFRCSFLCIDIEEDHSNESVSATDMYLYLLGRQTTPQHARNQYLTIHLLRAQAKSTASYIMNPLQSSKTTCTYDSCNPSPGRAAL